MGNVANRQAKTGSDIQADATFGAHWSLFVPTLAIAILYLGCWLALALFGTSGGALARFSLIVGLAAPPILLVLALLRYRAVRLVVQPAGLLIRSGPGADWQAIAWDQIGAIQVRRGVAGRLFATGTLIIDRRDAGSLVIRDLAEPDRVVALVERHLP